MSGEFNGYGTAFEAIGFSIFTEIPERDYSLFFVAPNGDYYFSAWLANGDFLTSTGNVNSYAFADNLLPAPQNIVDVAAGSDDFNILVQALSTAGLVETVQNAGDITVFAPTDAAFTSLAVQLGYQGNQADEGAVFSFIADTLASLDPNGDPIPLLTDILTYHVSPGAQSSVSGTVDTLLAGATFTANGSELVDNDPEATNPNIVATVDASNGVIQVIDNVLLPIDTPIGSSNGASIKQVRENDATFSMDFGTHECVYTEDVFFAVVPDTGAIKGTMFIDNDGDNLDGAGDSNVKFAEVRLLDTDGNVVATTNTDENGDYCFEDIPAGDYCVEFPSFDNPNLLVNSDFSDGGTGWAINNKGREPYTTDEMYGVQLDSGNFVGLTNTTGRNTRLKQDVEIDTAGTYYLKLEAIKPPINVIETGNFDVRINGTTIGNFGADRFEVAKADIFSGTGGVIAVQLDEGVNTIEINVPWSNYNNGIYVDNIELYADLPGIENSDTYVTANVGNDDTIDSDAGAGRKSDVLTVEKGETIENVDAGITLPKIKGPGGTDFTLTTNFNSMGGGSNVGGSYDIAGNPIDTGYIDSHGSYVPLTVGGHPTGNVRPPQPGDANYGGTFDIEGNPINTGFVDEHGNYTPAFVNGHPVPSLAEQAAQQQAQQEAEQQQQEHPGPDQTVQVQEHPGPENGGGGGNNGFLAQWIPGLSDNGDGTMTLQPAFGFGAVTFATPIALDLNGDGQIGVSGSSTVLGHEYDGSPVVEFDWDGDGVAEHSEWFAGDGDGILINLDRIGPNNEVNFSALYGDQGGTYATGYQQLATEEDTNGDGVVSGAELDNIGLWIDDGDAVLEAGELVTLASEGIKGIGTEATVEADGRITSEAGVDLENTGEVTYSLEGPDAAFFQIDRATGELTYANGFVPDFENPQDAGGDNIYDVTVVRSVLNSAGDCIKEPLREDVQIQVTDKDEGPSVDSGSGTTSETNGGALEIRLDGQLVTTLQVAPGEDIAGALTSFEQQNPEYGSTLQTIGETAVLIDGDNSTSVPTETVVFGGLLELVEGPEEAVAESVSPTEFDPATREDRLMEETTDIFARGETYEAASALEAADRFFYEVRYNEFGDVSGTKRADVIIDTLGDSQIFGKRGSDYIEGGDGNDMILAGRGRDTLDGGDGQDLLDGGFGHDKLTGGADIDIFVFRKGQGTTEIMDFEMSVDILDVEGFDNLTYEALTASGSQIGDDTHYTLGDDLLILRGAEFALITEIDLCMR